MDRIKKYSSKRADILGAMLFGAALLLSGITVYLCFSDDIWYDELFTIGFAGSNIKELITMAAADVHPPLYYLIVKAALQAGSLVVGGGYEIVIAKTVSLLPWLLLFLYGATKIRKHFGMPGAGLFTFLVSSMPQLSAYMTEMRMYGFALFFITAGMLHAYELVRESLLTINKKQIRNWAWVTFYSVAALYTHYFAAVAAVMIYAYLLAALIRHWWPVRGSISLPAALKPFMVSGIVCVLLYLPWLSAVISQVGQVSKDYWILPLTIRSVGGCVKFLFKPAFANDFLNTVLAVVLFLVYVVLLVLAWRDYRRNKKAAKKLANGKFFFAVALLSVLIGVVIFGFAASFLLRPVFIYRYMLPAMGAFWLCFCILLVREKERKYFFYPVLILLILVGLRNYRAFYGEEMWKRVQMEETQRGFEQIGEEDILVFNFLHTQGVTAYYLTNQSYLMWSEPEELIRQMYPQVHGFGELTEASDQEESQAQQILQWLKQGKKVWFLGSGNVREEIVADFKEQGIMAVETGSYLLERYWFNLYDLAEYHQGTE